MYNLDLDIAHSHEDSFVLPLEEAEIIYIPNFLKKEDADRYFKCFLDSTPWQQDPITIFGKKYQQPRLTALYGNNGKNYSYSGITMNPYEFEQTHIEIMKKISDVCDTSYSTVLMNLYRDGKDSNGWHSDDEPELGINPSIASVSLGATRFFHLKNKKDTTKSYKLSLAHGSLLLMKGATQHHWKHQLPKTTKPVKERINLTFRKII